MGQTSVGHLIIYVLVNHESVNLKLISVGQRKMGEAAGRAEGRLVIVIFNMVLYYSNIKWSHLYIHSCDEGYVYGFTKANVGDQYRP